MKTTINNNERVFMLLNPGMKKVFCNLRDVKTCLNQMGDKENVKIFHFWNGKFKRVGKIYLKEMLKANQLETI